MHKFLQAAPGYARRHTAGRQAVVLTLAAMILAYLLAPAIHVSAHAARAGHLAHSAEAAGLTESLLATSVAALSATEAWLVSFALAFAAGALLIGTAELLWRFSRQPDSRS